MWPRDNVEKAALVAALIVLGAVILDSSAASRWKEFTSTEGAFRVLMPEKPKTENQSIAVNGSKMELHSFSAWNRNNAEFTVTYADAQVPPTAAAGEKILDAQGQSLIQGDERRMLSAEKLIVSGYSVRQYKAIAEDGSEADEKLFLVKRRLYTLLVVHDRGRDGDDVKQFFNSFSFQPRE